MKLRFAIMFKLRPILDHFLYNENSFTWKINPAIRTARLNPSRDRNNNIITNVKCDSKSASTCLMEDN